MRKQIRKKSIGPLLAMAVFCTAIPVQASSNTNIGLPDTGDGYAVSVRRREQPKHKLQKERQQISGVCQRQGDAVKKLQFVKSKTGKVGTEKWWKNGDNPLRKTQEGGYIHPFFEGKIQNLQDQSERKEISESAGFRKGWK